jgi:hypothetical protein
MELKTSIIWRLTFLKSLKKSFKFSFISVKVTILVF